MKSLKQWCMENQEETLLKLYENAENKYQSDVIGFSASKIVNWKCEVCHMEWKQSLNSMQHKKKKDCPYCTRQRPSAFYNLLTELPILEEEWDYERNDKKPTNYFPKSKEKVWWKCKNGHIWQNSIDDRVKAVLRNLKKNTPTCPYCNHQKASSVYNLVTEFPNIARQWNYCKNGLLHPLEMTPKSNKKVWWICDYNPNHTWADTISNRTSLHRGCSICSREFTISYPSRVLYYYLKQSFYDCEMEYKALGKYILDICIPSYKIVIEYDGWYYHSNQDAEKRENKKDNILRKSQYEVIRIKEREEKMDEIVVENNNIYYHLQESYQNLDELIRKIICIIEEKTNTVLKKDIDSKRDHLKIENLYYHVRKSNTLAAKYPALIKEWSAHNDRTPDTFTISSNYKAKWICPKCNREYLATIYNRVKNNSNCSYCANRKPCEDNSLAKCFPQIAKEWHYEKNGVLNPNNITWGSDKMVWWKCEKGHEWQTRIYLRTGRYKSKCPYCSHRRLTYENSLEARNPELSDIWNFEKNEEKTLKDFSYSSNQRVWWKCPKGHEWLMSINQIQRNKAKEKCPYCTNRRVSEDNSLAVVNQELAKQWNTQKNGEVQPKDVLPSSGQVVWWKCEKGHEWKAKINLRNRGMGCPYCKGDKVAKENSLLEVEKEWNYAKNTEIQPENVSRGSGKTVWWICKKNHEWQDTVAHRTSGRGCPYCSGRRVTQENCLANTNQTIAKQWNYLRNGDLTPEQVSQCSGKKVWWICEKGHEWIASVSNRTKGTNCPICWEERRKNILKPNKINQKV